MLGKKLLFHFLIVLYNLLACVLSILTAPLILLFTLFKKKYRGRALGRLGFGLQKTLQASQQAEKKPIIWIHALSVGETTSALPLVRGLRSHYPKSQLIFSVSTSSGYALAQTMLAPHVDAVIPGPLDTLFTIRSFIHCIKPSLFILIETDFWPNWLYLLKCNNIPSMLVNGRISKPSFAQYKRLDFFFCPLFSCFSCLSMQTENDVNKMCGIGLFPEKVHALGNLKLDTTILNEGMQKTEPPLPRPSFVREHAILWICGSTHEGEEKILFQIFTKLQKEHQKLQMLLAPRDIGRSSSLVQLARQYGLICCQKTMGQEDKPDICILDTIGELAASYQTADIVFIGGSLVDAGGHNPLEAAVYGVPLLFGPHMEDFSEIAEALLTTKGAIQPDSEEDLYKEMTKLLSDQELRISTGEAARQWVRTQQGVVARHLEVIDQLINSS